VSLIVVILLVCSRFFLPANTSAEHKARRLEGKVAENAETIQQLREERALLASDHKDLQLRFTQLSEVRHHLRTVLSY